MMAVTLTPLSCIIWNRKTCFRAGPHEKSYGRSKSLRPSSPHHHVASCMCTTRMYSKFFPRHCAYLMNGVQASMQAHSIEYCFDVRDSVVKLIDRGLVQVLFHKARVISSQWKTRYVEKSLEHGGVNCSHGTSAFSFPSMCDCRGRRTIDSYVHV
jgi:hypothetical protein